MEAVATCCQFCKGSGLNWPAQHTHFESVQILDFLRETTIEKLLKILEQKAPTKSALRRCIFDACEIGLGHIRIKEHCAALTPEERRSVRVLALRHAAFVEAGFLLPDGDREAFDFEPSFLRIAFQSPTP